MKAVSDLLVVAVYFIAACQGRGIGLDQIDQSSGSLANLAGSLANTFNRLVSYLGAVSGLGGSSDGSLDGLAKTASAVSVAVDSNPLRGSGEPINDFKVSIAKDSDSVKEMIRINYEFVNDENFDDFDDRSSEFDFDFSVELNSKLVSGAPKEIGANSDKKVAEITIDLGKILEDLETSEEARITLIT